MTETDCSVKCKAIHLQATIIATASWLVRTRTTHVAFPMTWLIKVSYIRTCTVTAIRTGTNFSHDALYYSKCATHSNVTTQCLVRLFRLLARAVWTNANHRSLSLHALQGHVWGISTHANIWHLAPSTSCIWQNLQNYKWVLYPYAPQWPLIQPRVSHRILLPSSYYGY